MKIERQKGMPLWCLLGDNGGEYILKELENYCLEHESRVEDRV